MGQAIYRFLINFFPHQGPPRHRSLQATDTREHEVTIEQQVEDASILMQLTEIYGEESEDEFLEEIEIIHEDSRIEAFMPVVEIRRVPLSVREVIRKIKSHVSFPTHRPLSHLEAHPSHYSMPPDLTCPVNTSALVEFKQFFNHEGKLPKLSNKGEFEYWEAQVGKGNTVTDLDPHAKGPTRAVVGFQVAGDGRRRHVVSYFTPFHYSIFAEIIYRKRSRPGGQGRR